MSVYNISIKVVDEIKNCNTKLSLDDFVLGAGLFNNKCHMNSVQKVLEGEAVKVLMCLSIDTSDGWSCFHFINVLDDGKLQDNTLGWQYKDIDYYVIRELNNDELNNICDIFNDLRSYYFKKYSNFIDRLHINYWEIL